MALAPVTRYDDISRGVFCAGNPHNDFSACHGDSGGPMVKYVSGLRNNKNESSHFLQIGKWCPLTNLNEKGGKM